MINPGEQYFIEGDLPEPGGSGQPKKIKATSTDQVVISENPIPPGQENFAIFVAEQGTDSNKFLLRNLHLGKFLQPHVQGTQNMAFVEPDLEELELTPVQGEQDVYLVTKGTESDTQHLTIDQDTPGSPVKFDTAVASASGKQKWKFTKTVLHSDLRTEYDEKPTIPEDPIPAKDVPTEMTESKPKKSPNFWRRLFGLKRKK